MRVCMYIYAYIQLDEINIRTYENIYFLSFKHCPNKIFCLHLLYKDIFY